MKSAYEIAMERAEKLYDDEQEENSLEIRENLKKIMGPFFKGEMDAEGLWHELKDEKDTVLVEAQLMLVESIGLRNSSDQIRRRKEAVVAVDSLRESGKSSYFEKAFTQAESLQQQYETQKKQLDKQLRQHLQNAQGADNPLAAASNDDNRMNNQMKQQLAEKVSEFQRNFNKRFDKLINEIKEEIK